MSCHRPISVANWQCRQANLWVGALISKAAISSDFFCLGVFLAATLYSNKSCYIKRVEIFELYVNEIRNSPNVYGQNHAVLLVSAWFQWACLKKDACLCTNTTDDEQALPECLLNTRLVHGNRIWCGERIHQSCCLSAHVQVNTRAPHAVQAVPADSCWLVICTPMWTRLQRLDLGTGVIWELSE